MHALRSAQVIGCVHSRFRLPRNRKGPFMHTPRSALWLGLGQCESGYRTTEKVVDSPAGRMLQAQRAAQQRAEEVAERANLMEQYAAADRVEQLGAQRARLKVAEHRREVEALLAAKRAAFEQEQVCCTSGHQLHRFVLRFLTWNKPAMYVGAECHPSRRGAGVANIV